MTHNLAMSTPVVSSLVLRCTTLLPTKRSVIFALWPQSAPREHVDLLLWKYRAFVIALSVFGWHVYVHFVFNWNAHLNV